MIEPDSPSPWPKIDDAMVAFLLDARDGFEASLLRDWVETRKPHAGSGSRYSFIELPRGRADDWLAALSEEDDAVWLQPLRIAWLPAPDRRHDRPLLDFFHGRIAEPGKARRRWLAKHRPERLACIVGDGAYLEELRERQAKAAVEDDAFAEFAANQALIALERSERIFRGARYKVPRILPGEVFANADFRNLIANVAQQRDRPVGDVLQQAERYLREMAATQTPFTLEMINTLYRFACRSHHDSTIDVDESQLERVAETMATRPVIFLISHKSMLDTMALSLVLFGANLPLPLTFGGINLNTPGLGALARRSGIIFLRRSFQDNEIYKSTFRRYIDYDVTFIPVSVAYDQITEVEDYSIEQRGQRKKPEGITWPLRFLRRGRSRGQIHLRFGDGLTVRELVEPAELEAGIDDQQKQTLVATLAFEVAVRMNAATPITSTAIITLILLAGGTRAQSVAEIQALARAGAALIRRRHLEIVGRSNFQDADAVIATLAELHETGIVSYLDEGTERLYTISPDQHLNAAYYRNTAIHYFILDAFVEIALLDAAADTTDPCEAFFTRTDELRELFKFEFYFPRRAGYRSEIEKRVRERFGGWEDIVRRDEASLRDSLNDVQLLVAHGVLRSFVDAYRVVASVLESAGSDAVDDDGSFLTKCLKTGKQQLLQGRVFSAESISKSLYQTGLQLASYRGLLAANRAPERQEFHQEFRHITNRLDAILAITLAKGEDAESQFRGQ
jgi:glycerol-3-phosphate O-acyltransferase